jgi:hypothetical protein
LFVDGALPHNCFVDGGSLGSIVIDFFLELFNLLTHLFNERAGCLGTLRHVCHRLCKGKLGRLLFFFCFGFYFCVGYGTPIFLIACYDFIGPRPLISLVGFCSFLLFFNLCIELGICILHAVKIIYFLL